MEKCLTLSAGCEARRAPTPQKLPLIGFLTLACGLSTAGLPGQTEPPPDLAVSLSTDGESWSTSLAGNDAISHFLVRCSTNYFLCGGYYGGIYDVSVLDDLPELRPSVVSLGAIVRNFEDNHLAMYGHIPLLARPQDGLDFCDAALLLNGVPNNTQASLTLDPLYRPATVGAPIVQEFGLTPNPLWPIEADAGGFSIDHIRQLAFWRRLQPLYGPDIRGFFNSSTWAGILAKDHKLTISLVGVRGPNQTLGDGPLMGEPLPALAGFPGEPPLFLASDIAQITFTGTHQLTWKLSRSAPWSPPVLPIAIRSPGQLLVMPVSGFRPSMQVAIVKSAHGPQRYELDVSWSDFGKIEFEIPIDAVLGNYRVEEYRFLIDEVGGVPNYTDWRTLPTEQQQVISVQ